MNSIDVSAYTCVRQPGSELSLVQILELYREGYTTLDEAKSLAEKYAGDMTQNVRWLSVRKKVS